MDPIQTTAIGSGGKRLAAKAKRTLTSAAAARPPAERKESPGEELLHEIFRSQGMDLRESARTRGLVADLCTALKGGGK